MVFVHSKALGTPSLFATQAFVGKLFGNSQSTASFMAVSTNLHAAQFRSASNVIDPWNPSSNDIREWAFDAGADAPVQDFGLVLLWAHDERVYLDLASSDDCPKRRFFLSVLYLMVGDAVRNNFNGGPRSIIDGLIANGDNFPHPGIHKWPQRSRDLIANPESFDYDDWCGGRLASA
jgi:hypothetical protein